MCHHEKVIFIKTLYKKLSLTILKQEIKHVGQLFDKGWHNYSNQIGIFGTRLNKLGWAILFKIQ